MKLKRMPFIFLKKIKMFIYIVKNLKFFKNWLEKIQKQLQLIILKKQKKYYYYYLLKILKLKISKIYNKDAINDLEKAQQKLKALRERVANV